MLDTVENIAPGVLQFLGDNIAALVETLISNASIEEFEMGRDFIYFDLFGK